LAWKPSLKQKRSATLRDAQTLPELDVIPIDHDLNLPENLWDTRRPMWAEEVEAVILGHREQLFDNIKLEVGSSSKGTFVRILDLSHCISC
jgi:hypothetical protein